MACPECGFCSVPVATSSVKATTVLVKKNPMYATVTAEEELEIRPELGLRFSRNWGLGISWKRRLRMIRDSEDGNNSLEQIKLINLHRTFLSLLYSFPFYLNRLKRIVSISASFMFIPEELLVLMVISFVIM